MKQIQLNHALVFRMVIITALFLGGLGLLQAQEFAGGDGTEADPWQIETVVHLNSVRHYLGEENSDQHFIQTADLDLEDYLWDGDGYINDGQGWEPVGDEINRFTGKYNGNSKTISGLFIYRSQADYQGLFGYTDGAVIIDLGVTDGNVTGGEAVGVLAGLINNTIVTNCYTTGDVAGLLYTGGLAGRSSGSSEVFDCHSDATVAKYELPAPSESMPFIQGGTFTPAANYIVTLSSFYIGRYPVRQSDYMSIMGTNPSDFTGNTTRPVEMVSWFDAIEYCNRLSIRERLTPCYSYSDGTGEDSTYYGTNPDNWPEDWNADEDNHTNVSCNWNANGYRLPTEMEREFAARGGVPAQNAGTFTNRWPGLM